jgi:hypothetical protein
MAPSGPVSSFDPPEEGGLERRDFHLAAQAQRVCARPGCRSTEFAGGHHVVYQQELNRIGRSDALWDKRNALRVCPGCHPNHHGLHQLPLTCLSNANYEFAFEVLGVRAFDYLRHHYDGDDPRLDEWAERERVQS